MSGIENLYRLRIALGEVISAGDVTPMMCFPIGDWHSALYPDLPLTEDLANELIANFESGILGTEPVVDSSGKHDTSAPAAGWVKRVYLASYEEGDVTGLALWADVKWTALGATMLSDDEYKYGSVEIGPVTLNDSGDEIDNVLRSLTLTNTPVLRLMPGVKDAAEKQRVTMTLSLSEVTLAAAPVDPVAAILDDMDALAAKLDEVLKGKLGMPAIRTMLKEVRMKASSHALAEAVTKSEGAAGDFPAAAYAYTPDDVPSHWKLRLWATPTGGPDAGIVGAACAALGPGGFRGQKVQIPAADLPAVKVKVAAAWKKANPDKSVDEMPTVIKAAEAGSTNDQREALEQALGDAFGAMHKGLYLEDFGPDWVVFYTWSAGAGDSHYYRVDYQQISTGTTFGQPVEVERDTTYVPVTDSSPAGRESASSTALSQDAKAKEGHGAHLAEGDAAQKGADHHMDTKTLTTLKLAEGADDVAIDAAVMALAEDRDAEKTRAEAAVLQLAERDKAERKRGFEAKLAEAMKPDEKQVVHILPGEKDTYLSLAEIDHDKALDAVDARMKGPGLKLGEVGSSSEGDDGSQYANASVELAERAKARKAKDNSTYEQAERLVLAEDHDLSARYDDYRAGKE